MTTTPNDDGSIVRHVPARAVVAFAGIRRGGSGRFDLIVNAPPGVDGPVVVRPGLSMYQASEAAMVINDVLGEWLARGMGT